VRRYWRWWNSSGGRTGKLPVAAGQPPVRTVDSNIGIYETSDLQTIGAHPTSDRESGWLVDGYIRLRFLKGVF